MRPALVLGVGAQKSGTTWLHHWLSKHPECASFPGKEKHYWDYLQAGRLQRDDQSYLQSLIKTKPQAKVALDTTPAYSILSKEWVAQIRQSFPESRAIFLVRDPLERAVAALDMARVRCQLSEAEVTPDWVLCLLASRAFRARSRYDWFLQSWAAPIADGAVYIDSYTKLAQRPQCLLKELSEWLGIDTGFWNAYEAKQLAAPVSPTAKRSSPEWRATVARWVWNAYAEDLTAAQQAISQLGHIDTTDWLNLKPATGSAP